ncbi:MAG TPA: hypothetical protein VGG75_18860 [Trebonia sp.]
MMDIEVRPVTRLAGSPRAQAAFGPLIAALAGSGADLSRLRVACDWIQYRNNFRETAAVRPILPPLAPSGTAPLDTVPAAHELAVDLRRCAAPDADVAAAVGSALAGLAADPDDVGQQDTGQQDTGQQDRVWLEDWVPGSASCVWRFNALYWQHLADWEKAAGREYERALPGGESAATNQAAARELILDLFKVWDELANRRALPEELYVLELGVGNGGQARTFLDEFAALDRRHGREYYRRLHYLMGDYSAHVLDRAREAVAPHQARVSGLVVEATRLRDSLAFLAGKAFCVYISNVYDNLPADEVAAIRGRVYLVQVRSYLPGAAAQAIGQRFSLAPGPPGGTGALVPLVKRLLRIGPELLAESVPEIFGSTQRATEFWQETWAALRQAERYVPLEGLDTYEITPGVTGEIMRPLLTAEGDVRMHVSNGALSSFAGTLPLLHPFGRVVCHDLFTTAHEEYHAGFFGPGKYDGSTVNWVNGPLLALLASRRGFEAGFTPFTQRPSAHVKTLTAQVRD